MLPAWHRRRPSVSFRSAAGPPLPFWRLRWDRRLAAVWRLRRCRRPTGWRWPRSPPGSVGRRVCRSSHATALTIFCAGSRLCHCTSATRIRIGRARSASTRLAYQTRRRSMQLPAGPRRTVFPPGNANHASSSLRNVSSPIRAKRFWASLSQLFPGPAFNPPAVFRRSHCQSNAARHATESIRACAWRSARRDRTHGAERLPIGVHGVKQLDGIGAFAEGCYSEFRRWLNIAAVAAKVKGVP